MTLSIANWDELYENNRTRAMKAMRWVPVPNKQDGDGYTELLDHPNGAAHYGAWMAIVLVASKQKTRGTLVRESGTQVRPHDSRSLSRVTRVPAEIIEEAIPRLVSIGWLEETDDVTRCSDDSCRGAPDERQEGAGKVPDARTQLTIEGKGMEGNGREENGKEEIETVKTPSASPPGGGVSMTPEKFVSCWNKFVSDKPSLSKVMKLTAGRRKKLLARLKDREWYAAFKLALNRLPLPGLSDGWQPNLDWLIRNEDNVYRITEGEFAWRAKDDPARQKLEQHRTKVIYAEHERQLADEQNENRKNVRPTRQAIESILPAKDGDDGDESGESLLFGRGDDSSANGAQPSSLSKSRGD